MIKDLLYYFIEYYFLKILKKNNFVSFPHNFFSGFC